jgi:2-methylaconitate cis-trans-isomerase PrpF
MALVRAEDIGMTATESPAEVDNNERVCGILERVRGEAAFAMGMIPHSSASKESPATPKIGFFSGPKNYVDISGREVSEADMDICVRIISVSRCHKASPLTSACAVAASALIKGTIVRRALCDLGIELSSNAPVRIGHPGGVMTMYADVATGEETTVRGVAVQRTARRIMDGFIYVRK